MAGPNRYLLHWRYFVCNLNWIEFTLTDSHFIRCPGCSSQTEEDSRFLSPSDRQQESSAKPSITQHSQHPAASEPQPTSHQDYKAP